MTPPPLQCSEGTYYRYFWQLLKTPPGWFMRMHFNGTRCTAGTADSEGVQEQADQVLPSARYILLNNVIEQHFFLLRNQKGVLILGTYMYKAVISQGNVGI